MAGEYRLRQFSRTTTAWRFSRPLQADPKEARRRRAANRGLKGGVSSAG